MHTQITALWGGTKVELRETRRAVTPFGGLVVFFEFLQRIGYREGARFREGIHSLVWCVGHGCSKFAKIGC